MYIYLSYFSQASNITCFGLNLSNLTTLKNILFTVMHLQWKTIIQAGRTAMFFNIWELLFFTFVICISELNRILNRKKVKWGLIGSAGLSI